ncbi:preprotein translocase subunit SecG [Paracoccus sp. SSK6]|uniref:preprotein translocase subunit SecG n=1 Tax=Paracoccus sp. SSK6 TaxID=3143131 RepID=UPI00321AEC75
MENVVLTIHLILAVLLTGVVLLQRSEGGGLGMGGGGGVMTGRQAANALTRLTWIFGIALFVTSIALTIIAARQVSNSSIMDQLGVPASRQESTLPQVPAYVPPPSTGTAGDPLTPPAPDAPAADTAVPEAAAPAAEPVAPPAAEPAATPAAPAEAPAN